MNKKKIKIRVKKQYIGPTCYNAKKKQIMKHKEKYMRLKTIE